MILQFDFTRLVFFQRERLRKILDVIQSENKREIVVFSVELPYKFLVLADDTVELLEGLEFCDQDDHRRLIPGRSPALETKAIIGDSHQGRC